MSDTPLCQDCQKFIYRFDITLVDEQNQSIGAVPYQVFDGQNAVASGTTTADGKIVLTDMPPRPLRLVLEHEPFLEVMQQENRYLRQSRKDSDSPIQAQAKEKGFEYHFLKVGNLIDQLPTIADWPVQDVNNPNWQDKDGNPLPLPPLPSYHFPYENPQGFVIKPMGEEHKERTLILEVSPFRAWVLALEHSDQYSLVNAYNLALMSILAYARFDKQEKKTIYQGSIHHFFCKQLCDLSKLPRYVNKLNVPAVVVDVPFNQRYTQYEFIDTSEESYGNVGDTQLFYATSTQQAIIGWRGTAGGSDVWTDIKGIQTDSAPIINGKMHLGFKQSFEEKEELNRKGKQAFRRLNNNIANKELFICGHSLGGALALIDSATKQALKPVLYTYGMPRVFSRSAVAQINVIHFRHVNDDDLVASVPHSAWTNNKLFQLGDMYSVVPRLVGSTFMPESEDDYQHQGTLVHFVQVNGYLGSESERRKAARHGFTKDLNISTKLLVVPEAIGATCENVFDLLCEQYDSIELDAPVDKGLRFKDHSSALYADYLGLRLAGKLHHDLQKDGQGYEIEKAQFLKALEDYRANNKYTLALGLADNKLLEQEFVVDINQVPMQYGLLRFLSSKGN